MNHKIRHQYQPTTTSCSPTALSILLEHYGDNITPEDIESSVPQCINEKGENVGTITQQLATWCLSRGYDVVMHTFDCQVIDQSWANLDKDKALERLKLRKEGWGVPALGSEWTKAYVKSYIDFIEAGGELNISPSISSKLINELLETGPVLTCVSYSTLHGAGRSRHVDSQTAIDDDINGRAMNHTIVIYGANEKGRFMIADSWKKPGLHTIEPERLIAGISTAQIECDNLLFQITPRK